MNDTSLESKSVVVAGASRGLGRGIALAAAAAGSRVVGLARDGAGLESLEAEGEGRVVGRVCDVTEPDVAPSFFRASPPDAVVLVAGVAPEMRPLSAYDWDAFCKPWFVDVQMTFRWLQAALRANFAGHIIVISSGAALHGSPLSGGYAGAKQTQRFLAKYALSEAGKGGSSLRVQTVLPQLNPNTALGRAGVEAYAAAAGESVEGFVRKRFGEALTPAVAGAAIVELLTRPEHRETPEFMLTGQGLKALGG